MQETDENLIEKALCPGSWTFEQISDEQTEAFQLKTGKLRTPALAAGASVDSTQIASNIRRKSRQQLLVEVLRHVMPASVGTMQRVHRMISREDQRRYQGNFEPYLKGSSGQYIYHIKGEEVADHLQPVGELMHRLVNELRAGYGQEPTYQMMVRFFQEHFLINESDLRPREEEELSAGSLPWSGSSTIAR